MPRPAPLERLQRRDRLFASHCREVIQEFVEAVAPFEIIDEIAQRYQRAHEDGCASQDFGVAMHDRLFL